jgi:hemerythrin
MLDRETIPKVALDVMNEVHYEEVDLIIELLKRLDAVAAEKLPAEALDTPLENLLEHIRAHFAGEEERMEAAGFPPYPVHKAEHDRVLAEASGVCQAWRSGRDLQALSAYLRRTLPTWMTNHIATMDMITAQFLAARGWK